MAKMQEFVFYFSAKLKFLEKCEHQFTTNYEIELNYNLMNHYLEF